mgnify:CR=1 FL=1
MGKVVQLTLNFDQDLEAKLQQKHGNFRDYRLLGQSLDARGANRGRSPKYHYRVELVYGSEKFSRFQKQFPQLPPLQNPPIIIGAGPAGLFCALRFSEYGIPCQIFERGSRAHQRMKSIARFWRYGELYRDDNVCFGEGGAGLFSDGKLITRIKSPHVSYVMQRFVDFGAPEDTAYVSNPHLGSNKIRGLINKITDHLRSKGTHVHYNTRVESLLTDSQNQRVVGIQTSDGKNWESDHVILATGHSADEMYRHLKHKSVQMRRKDFAVGVRIEHPRRLIDHLQYGKFADDKRLGSARYRLSYHNHEEGRGTYSFCMCPGGYVLSSGTKPDGIVVNGMSNYARNSPWSNAALVVTVDSHRDLKGESSASDPLSGLEFQHSIEKKAHQLSLEKASGKELPGQNLKDFLQGGTSQTLAKSSTPSKTVSASLFEVLPDFVHHNLFAALNEFDKKMPGFVTDEALLLAPETRTSAPLTIERSREAHESLSHRGLYPCGEGAGHAGGITSAAVDGIDVAESILSSRYDLNSK